MSKQSEAKKRQNYNPKPILRHCSTCANYRFDKVTMHGEFGGTWDVESNMRCGIGGFKVMKRGTCTEHKFATTGE